MNSSGEDHLLFPDDGRSYPQWSGSAAFIENQPIIEKGPYAIVRHPIYTGVISML